MKAKEDTPYRASTESSVEGTERSEESPVREREDESGRVRAARTARTGEEGATHQAAPAQMPWIVMSVLYEGLDVDEVVLVPALAPDELDDPPLEPSPAPPVGAASLVSPAASAPDVPLAAPLPPVLAGSDVVERAVAEDADPPLEPPSLTSTGDSGGSTGAESAVNMAERST